jgi:hypothetical protein
MQDIIDYHWNNFYNSVKDPLWPKCESLNDFLNLPDWIQKEVLYQHNGNKQFEIFFSLIIKETSSTKVELLPLNKKYKFLVPKKCSDLKRVGSANDGGYVIPFNLLNECDSLLSGGIGDNWEFEENFLHLNPAVLIHAYDKTVDQTTTAYQQMWKRSNCHHFSKHLLGIESELELIDSKKTFVKLDIEGGEYRCIDDIVKNSNKIVGMTIEFHNIDDKELQFTNSVKKLQEKYSIVHVHANNFDELPAKFKLPKTLELTLVRQDFLLNFEDRTTVYLYDIDRPNNRARSDWFLFFME